MHKLLPVDITAITHFFCWWYTVFFRTLSLSHTHSFPLLTWCGFNSWSYYSQLHLHFCFSSSFEKHVPLFVCICGLRLKRRLTRSVWRAESVFFLHFHTYSATSVVCPFEISPEVFFVLYSEWLVTEKSVAILAAAKVMDQSYKISRMFFTTQFICQSIAQILANAKSSKIGSFFCSFFFSLCCYSFFPEIRLTSLWIVNKH